MQVAPEISFPGHLQAESAPTSPPDYWSESRGPLASLLFLSPLLLVYEGGVLLEEAAAARNAADLWLRMILDALGLGHYFLLPMLLVALLLGWHYTTGARWRVSPATVFGMAIESAGLSFLLWLVLQWQAKLWQISAGAPISACPPWLVRTISYVGAGLYEELLFRLLLLPLVVGGFRLLGTSRSGSWIWGIVCTSGLFAIAHHLTPAGEPWHWATFALRFSAGIFFCALFWLRGFGITAGTHAGYDILVGVLLA